MSLTSGSRLGPYEVIAPPDSQRVLFVSGGKNFFVIDTRSRGVRKVFSVERDVIGPLQLSRDGREAYFSRRVTEADIRFLTIGG
jgi:hypothetical protein